MNESTDPAAFREAAEQPPPRRLNILMVEDSENDALLIADSLRRGGFALTWTRVDSAAELRAALPREPWHAVLSDWRLPGFPATEAFAVCRESAPDVPFLIVSGSSNDDAVAAAASLGIRFWVSKDHIERLAAVLAQLGIGR